MLKENVTFNNSGYYSYIILYHLSKIWRSFYSTLTQFSYITFYFVYYLLFKDSGKPDKLISQYGTLNTRKGIKTPIIKARVLKVYDGDTLLVKSSSGEKFTVRTFGVDAPEIDQPYGIESRNFLNNLIGFRKVELVCCDTLSYDRKVCLVFFKNQCINEIMLREGLVWHEKSFAPNMFSYDVLERNAKFQAKGLWADQLPVPPWEWRNFCAKVKKRYKK